MLLWELSGKRQHSIMGGARGSELTLPTSQAVKMTVGEFSDL